MEALGYIGSSKMSQPQDDEGLPSQLTHALLSEDSRSGLPPRRQAEILTPAPAVVAAASAYAPFAARPVAAPVAAPGPVRTAPVAAPTLPQPQQQQPQQVVAPQQQQQQPAAAAQPQQQQQVRQGGAVAVRWQNKNETAAQTGELEPQFPLDSTHFLYTFDISVQKCSKSALPCAFLTFFVDICPLYLAGYDDEHT